MEFVGHDGHPTAAIKVPGIDTVLNGEFALDGTDQGIGIIEDGGCRLLGEHEAFASTTIVNGAFIDSCMTAQGCDCGGGAQCVDDGTFNPTCVDSHASRIASTIAQEVTDGQFGAWNATIYYPNKGDICNSSDIDERLYWLSSNQYASTITESYGCFDGEDGLTQDWYARYREMAVFRASGNLPLAETTEAPCRALNSICVGGISRTGPTVTSSFRVPRTSTPARRTATGRSPIRRARPGCRRHRHEFHATKPSAGSLDADRSRGQRHELRGARDGGDGRPVEAGVRRHNPSAIPPRADDDLRLVNQSTRLAVLDAGVVR